MFNNNSFFYGAGEKVTGPVKYNITTTSSYPMEVRWLDGSSRFVSSQVCYETDLTPEDAEKLLKLNNYKVEVKPVKPDNLVFKDNKGLGKNKIPPYTRLSDEEFGVCLDDILERLVGDTKEKEANTLAELEDQWEETLSEVIEKIQKDQEESDKARGVRRDRVGTNPSGPGYVTGIKEEDGKLNYELDWDFIQGMAERMAQNKKKYGPYNWKKPMEVEKLKQSLLRHTLEIMKGSYEDDSREFGHFEAVALNAMMVVWQLRSKKD